MEKSVNRIIVIGNDSFNDYNVFKEKVLFYYPKIARDDIIVTGYKFCLDSIIDRFSSEYNLLVEKYEHFDEMVSISNNVIFFWDGNDKEIFDFIKLSYAIGLNVKQVIFDKDSNCKYRFLNASKATILPFISNCIPVTISYLKDDSIGCFDCYIEEFKDSNFLCTGEIDFLEAFFPKNTKPPYKAYIIGYMNTEKELDLVLNEDLEEATIPCLFLTRLPIVIDSEFGLDFFPYQPKSLYTPDIKQRSLDQFPRTNDINKPDIRSVVSPVINSNSVDFETFCKAYDFFGFKYKLAKMMYDIVQCRNLRLIKLGDNVILNKMFETSKYTFYYKKPAEWKLYSIKRTPDISEEDVINAISRGEEDYI